jgi:uncharacterized YccA/Bax inhibitor family protein
MALIKTSNPALSENTFRDLASSQYGGATGVAAQMTLEGTVNKTGILLVCVMATAWWTWNQFIRSRDMADVAPWMLIGFLGGFVLAMVTIFKKEWSPVTAPIYALLEGLALGGLSAVIDLRYPGIAIQAVGLTFGTLFVLLLAYRSGLIRVTQKFRMGIVAATGGIMVFYLLQMLMGFFGCCAGRGGARTWVGEHDVDGDGARGGTRARRLACRVGNASGDCALDGGCAAPDVGNDATAGN